MAFETITMAILTHPVHVLFAAVVLFHVAKPVLAKLTAPKAVVRQARAAA